MNDNELASLIARGEYEKLDFKRQWYSSDTDGKRELAKDIIALTNGNAFHVGETAYLIIGVSEGKGGAIECHDIAIEKEVAVYQREVTKQVNSYAEPSITKLAVDLIEFNGARMLVISIPQHPYVISLKKDLRLPTYRRGDVLYRVGESTEVAGFEERKALELKVGIYQPDENQTKRLTASEKEIRIDAENILRLAVSKRDFRSLSPNLGHRNSNGIFYIFHRYNDSVASHGFIFLGSRSVNKRVFPHFIESFGSQLPNTLEFFLAKKLEDGQVVDRKRDILKLCETYGLAKVVGTNVHYIDDFIWDNTLSDASSGDAHKRSDFIDQDIYDELTGECLGVSLKFVMKQIYDTHHPISVITGSGGVGKSTFCDALEYTITSNNIRKMVFYIKGEKVAQFLSRSDNVISSLEDIYDLYKSETNFPLLTVDDFKLNYISGNIVVIIDAIDEIDSALGDRFILSAFLNALRDLNENFFSTHIILTTRDHYCSKIRDASDAPEIKYFSLKGFTKNDLNEFLSKRYSGDIKQSSQANEFINNNNLFTQNGHVIPLFVDWVCKIVERPEVVEIPTSTYFLTNHRIDKLLLILMQREINKQSLNITEDGMCRLLEEIIIHNNGQIALPDFQEYIELETGDEVSKYHKNPLLSVSREHINIRYDVLINYIQTRFLYHSIIDGHYLSERLIVLLRECNNTDSELFLSLSSIASDGIQHSHYAQIIAHLRSKYAVTTRTSEKESIKKSISAILHLAVAQFKPQDKASSTELIKSLYSADLTIKNLFIYGGFPPIDFSELTVSESSFSNYDEFHKCGFPDKERVIFLYSEFKSFNIPKSNKLKQCFFDSSCSFSSCNINEIVGRTEKEHIERLRSLNKDVSVLAGYIDTSMKSVNLIKQYCSISYPKGEKRLLDNLIKIGFIERSKVKGDLLYKISSAYYDELPAIKLGRLPSELVARIQELAV